MQLIKRRGTFFITAVENKFEDREGQQNMALDVAEAIRDCQHIVIEAGVGIEKSFAYLVPLILYNKYVQQPVAITTSTYGEKCITSIFIYR